MAERTGELPPELRADCAACVGLCCVVPPFDTASGFGFDKPARTPCRHLCADFRCGIHDQLADFGFSGCVRFDCHGAGQRVSQRLFPGADWTRSPLTARRMFDAFSVMRALHEMMAMLHVAHAHTHDARLATQLDEIERLCECTPVDEIYVSDVRRQVLASMRLG